MNRSRATLVRLATRLGVVFCLMACTLGCDQFTKHLATSHLKGHGSYSFCGDTVRLVYAENPGAFLGLGGQMPPAARSAVLIVINGVVAASVGIALIVVRRISVLGFVACALLMAGALGNLIDRLRFDGHVVDFLNVGLGPVRTGIFNVADMAIMLGAGLMILESFSRPAAGQKLEAGGRR